MTDSNEIKKNAEDDYIKIDQLNNYQNEFKNLGN